MEKIEKTGVRFKVNGSWGGWKYTYQAGSPITWTETIHYKANTPPIIQTKYTPFNLNYNTYAKRSNTIGILTDTSFYNKDPLNMEVNNLHEVNGKLLEALDINNDYQFKVKFNNKYYGLSDLYDWYNTPPALANGTWENSNHSLPYANGYSGQGDGYYRYDTILNASMNDGNKKVSSFIFNNKEYTSIEALESINKTSPIFTGGDMYARFILTGQYTTGNKITSTKFPEWWVVNYNQAKSYEYGTEYEGYIDSLYIYKPSLLNGCQSSTTVSSNSPFTNNGETIELSTNGINNRALYVAYAIKNANNLYFMQNGTLRL